MRGRNLLAATLIGGCIWCLGAIQQARWQESRTIHVPGNRQVQESKPPSANRAHPIKDRSNPRENA